MISEEKLSKIHSAINRIIGREAKFTLKLPIVLMVKTATKEEWVLLTNALQMRAFERDPLKLWEKVFSDLEIKKEDIEYVGFLSIGPGIFAITEEVVEKIAKQLKRSPDEIRELIKNSEGILRNSSELSGDLKLIKTLLKEDAGQCIIIFGDKTKLKVFRASVEAKSQVSTEGELMEIGFELGPFEVLPEVSKETHESDWLANKQISCVFSN